MLENNQKKIEEYVNDKLGLFVAGCNISFNTVESFHFIQLVKVLCKVNFSYKPPCRRTLATTIIPRIHEKIEKRRKRLIKNTDAVLLCDGWKNKSAKRKMLVFTLRNEFTPQIFLTSKDVSLEREFGENLRDNIDEAVKYAKEKYNTNVYSIVTDNDNKIKKGGRITRSELWQSTCNSHSGSLTIKSLYHKDANLKKFREIFKVFAEPKFSTLLCKMGGTKLLNYPDTRFNFIRDSYVSLLRNIKILREICNFHEVPKSVKDCIQSDIFVREIQAAVEKITPLCKLINDCQDPKKNVADAVQHWLTLQNVEFNNAQWIQNRIKNAVHPVGFAANLLHHKYKGSLLSNTQKKIALEFLNQKMTADEKREKELFDIDNRFHLFVKASLDPLAFYGCLRNFYPSFANFATKLFLIPASTALIEGLFSTWTYVHSPTRNRLAEKTSIMLLDIYYSLNYEKYKLRKKKAHHVEIHSPAFVYPIRNVDINIDIDMDHDENNDDVDEVRMEWEELECDELDRDELECDELEYDELEYDESESMDSDI